MAARSTAAVTEGAAPAPQHRSAGCNSDCSCLYGSLSSFLWNMKTSAYGCRQHRGRGVILPHVTLGQGWHSLPYCPPGSERSQGRGRKWDEDAATGREETDGGTQKDREREKEGERQRWFQDNSPAAEGLLRLSVSVWVSVQFTEFHVAARSRKSVHQLPKVPALLGSSERS